MRKILAVLLIAALSLTLFACGGTTPPPADTSGGTTPPPADTSDGETPAAPESPQDTPPAEVGDGSSPFPNANPDGTINLDKIAHYDVNYDYTQNEKIKICYIAQDGGPLYQQSAAAYEHWTPLYNMEWAGFISTNGDADLYMTSLQNMLDQGVRAFILDPDNTIIPAVADLISDYEGVAWMSQMAPPRDAQEGAGIPVGGNLINPYVGFNNYDAGFQVSERLIEWKEETYPDVPWSEIGFISMAFSLSPPLNERVQASKDVWVAATGSEDGFFIADCASTGINLQGGLDAVTPVITTNTDYQYWLVNGLIDDFAQAAASVISQQGLTDNSCVITFGGSGLQMQWDMGQQDSFRYALFTAQNLYAEPIIGGVYAFIQGWATPNTIWPSWVKWDDHGTEGNSYPQLRLPTVWLDHESYKHYLEWTDIYAKANAYDYPQDGISLSDFSPFVDEIPADFKAP